MHSLCVSVPEQTASSAKRRDAGMYCVMEKEEALGETVPGVLFGRIAQRPPPQKGARRGVRWAVSRDSQRVPDGAEGSGRRGCS